MCCGRCKEACARDAIEVNGKMMVISNDCTYCGLCEKPCPTRAIRVDHANKKLEIDASLCTRCRACEQSCPWSAIKIGCLDCLLCLGETNDVQRISHLLVKSRVNINEARCVYCGRCEIDCLTGAINVVKPFEGRISIETT